MIRKSRLRDKESGEYFRQTVFQAEGTSWIKVTGVKENRMLEQLKRIWHDGGIYIFPL